MLRDPVHRYISEWQHVQRGATWRRSKHICNGRRPSLTELPPCYGDFDWSGVSLPAFLRCRSNLAINRQTRMLADLELVGCYNQSYPDRDERMLRDAKRNLSTMAFFGLLEHLLMTQYLFQHTFGLVFAELWAPLNVTHSALVPLSGALLRDVRAANSLDERLYAYSEGLFLSRVAVCVSRDRPRVERCCGDLERVIDWARLGRGDGGYVRQRLALVNEVLHRLLLLDGSRAPTDTVVAERDERWQRKVHNDLLAGAESDEY